MVVRRATAIIISMGIAGCASVLPSATSPSVPPTTHMPVVQPTRSQPTLTSLPSANSTATITPTISPTPSVTPTPPSWEYIAPGMAQTVLLAPAPETGADIAITVVRLNPALVRFQVHYDPVAPRSMAEWLQVTQANLVFNGGFFSGDNRPVGRLVIDGDLYGAPISLDRRIGTSGLFTVVDNQVSIYALGLSNYTPRGMRFEQAIEGYPMLLLPGQQVVYPDHPGRRARRTVVGLDEEGYVIVLLVDSVAFNLYELAQWLAISNLRLSSALNLDGGRSSGMAINTPNYQTLIPAYVPLPIVVAVHTR